MADFKQIIINGQTYTVKDEVARQAISGGLSFNIVWTATQWASTTAPTSTELASVPADVIVYYNSGASSATGTKAASSTTTGFFLVYRTSSGATTSVYDEYAAIRNTDSTYFWEKIGSTALDLKGLVTDVSVATKPTDEVLGSGTTFTNAASSVTFGTPGTGSFVTGFEAPTRKLNTTSIKGVGGTTSIVPATAIAAGSRPHRVTIGGTGGTAFVSSFSGSSGDIVTSVSGTFVTSAIRSASLTGTQTFNTDAIKSASLTGTKTFNTDAIKSASISGSYDSSTETLTLSVSTSEASTGTVGISTEAASTGTVGISTEVAATGSVSYDTSEGYIIDDITSSTISIAEVEVAKAGTAVTVATAAASNTTVATGGVSTSGDGDTVCIGIDAGTGTAITSMPTATAAAQTITVGSNDKVNAMTNVTLNVTKHS